jgi:hypothetical protein
MNQRDREAERIERHVEAAFDRYDRALMDGRLDQAAYDELARGMNVWADEQYRNLAAAKIEEVVR